MKYVGSWLLLFCLVFNWQYSAFSVSPLFRSQAQLEPTVKNIRIKGKKLIVTGENFADGSVIRLFENLEPQKTRTQPDSPSTLLIAPKAGNKIPVDKKFCLDVLSNQLDSNTVCYFRTASFLYRVLPTAETAYLKVGDYVLTANLEAATRTFFDSDILRRITSDASLPEGYWLYQSVHAGVTRFYAEFWNGGEVPPAVLYDTPIIVE